MPKPGEVFIDRVEKGVDVDELGRIVSLVGTVGVSPIGVNELIAD